MKTLVAVQLFVLALICDASAQQRFEAGAQLPIVRSDAFDEIDTGFGGRFSWYPANGIGLDAEINLYPQTLGTGAPFSRGRVEGLFGVTAGPRLGLVRPFAKLRPGFVTFQDAPGLIACILIFPPPLSCTLAAGRTMFALDVGGGIDLSISNSGFVRVDAGDRLIKYPGPSLLDGLTRQGSFFSHDLRVSAGAGLRF